MGSPYQSTPSGYYVIGGLAILNGLFGIVSGIGLLSLGAGAGSGLAVIIGILFIILSLPALIGGYGLAKNTVWGWWIVAFILVINVIAPIGTLVSTGEVASVPIIQLVVNAGALVYMILAKSDSSD